jgi:hypothetical protein
MASAATSVRERVIDIVEAEFSAEGLIVTNDKLTRAAGKDGETVAAVYPEAEYERPGQVIELVVPVVLQIYMAYEAEPDETIQVDPGVIEDYGDRLREAFRTQSSGNTGDMWFLRLTRIDYPDDPTGNKSRLEAQIEGYGNNQASLPA